MNYPTVEDVERILKRPAFYGTDAHVMNRGQLEAALERPKSAFYGREQYPELYQKAAVLMEALCKSHALSDGNKRTAMAVTQMMVGSNGCRLVLPLKSVRLLVDTAMDNDNRMSDEIQAWFKVHVASNPVQLRIMLEENMQENRIVEELWKQDRNKAGKMLDAWLAFDNYPELKEMWEAASRPDRGRSAVGRDWRTRIPVLSSKPRHDTDVRQSDSAEYAGHSLEESRAHDIRIRRRESAFDESSMDELWDAVRVFDGFGFMNEALAYLDKIQGLGDRDGAQRHKVHVLFDMGRHAECAELGRGLAARGAADAQVISSTSYACYHTGDHQEAMAVLDSMQEKDMREHMHQKSLMLYETGRKDEAYKLLDQAFRAGLEDRVGVMIKAGMLARDGLAKEAVALYDKALEMLPDDADALYLKGTGLEYAGDRRRAQECYRRALKADPGHVRSMVALGAGLASDGRTDGAAAYFEAALDTDPGDMPALLNLGNALSTMRRYGEAIECLEKLRRASPESAPCLYELAAAHSAGGDLDEASLIAARLFKADPRAKEWAAKDPRFARLLGPEA